MPIFSVLCHFCIFACHSCPSNAQVTLSFLLPLLFFSCSNYIIVRRKVSWAGLICHTHQHYHHQWLPNTEWSNSRRSAKAREGIDSYGCFELLITRIYFSTCHHYKYFLLRTHTCVFVIDFIEFTLALVAQGACAICELKNYLLTYLEPYLDFPGALG